MAIDSSTGTSATGWDHSVDVLVVGSGAIAGTYPGPGCTLGPATTFGYIAARHLTQKN